MGLEACLDWSSDVRYLDSASEALLGINHNFIHSCGGATHATAFTLSVQSSAFLSLHSLLMYRLQVTVVEYSLSSLRRYTRGD